MSEQDGAALNIPRRLLGRSGRPVSMIGLGCWAIGGEYRAGGRVSGWGAVNDDESIRAIHRALDLGVTFLDTSDAYGCGHSERLIGKALAGRRDRAFIATKVGHVFDEAARTLIDQCADPPYIRQACDASRRRLDTEVIDLYQFHLGRYDIDKAAAVRDTFEDLVAEGKIRHYGWSTDDAERAAFFAGGEHCVAVQQAFNLFDGDAATLDVCERMNLASIIRGPLAKGLLTGKFARNSTPPDDLRRDWDFKTGAHAERLEQLETLRPTLTRDGRTLTQAALGWLWARSEKMIPIPGFKTVAQVEENAGACRFGPLEPDQMAEIENVLGR